jgi:hypothetical protein
MMFAVKRGVVVIGCAVAFAAGPLALASPATADGCPWGTSERFPGVCVNGSSGRGAPSVVIPQESAGGAQVSQDPGGTGSVNGVPCTPEHYGTCFAMQQNG